MKQCDYMTEEHKCLDEHSPATELDSDDSPLLVDLPLSQSPVRAQIPAQSTGHPTPSTAEPSSRTPAPSVPPPSSQVREAMLCRF